jgi:hypothetical protein
MPAVRTLECDLKTEVDFVPRGADFEMRLETEVDFVPCGVDFEMRLENRSRLCAARSGL